MAARLILALLALWPAVVLAQAANIKARPAGPAPVLARELIIRQTGPALGWFWRAAPEAGLEPNLLRAMRGEALADAAKARKAAEKDRARAEAAGFPFRRHEYWTDWAVEADAGRLLVLMGTSWQYTGGAHGNTGHAGRLWDRQAGRSIGIEALFNDWPRARRLIEPAYCAALDAERRRRRGDARLIEEFETCPPLAEQLILPSSVPVERRARMVRIVLDPYVAGPFSEGSYELTLPWPEGVAALVATPWRAALLDSREVD